MTSRRSTPSIVTGVGLTVLGTILLTLLHGDAEGLALVPFAGGLVLLVVALQRRRVARDEDIARLAPGFYQDPDSSARLRFHDGRQWTERTREKDL
ncbi:MAG: DUF2510 domain-containing protein [bacterium]|nr:DUF2510 domain-containing protein [bacterium]